MKLLLIFLTIVLFSFKVNALKIEKIYNMCKPFQSKGFSRESLTAFESDNAGNCISYLKGLADLGYTNCIALEAILKEGKDNLSLGALVVLKSRANAEPKTYGALITSFINFAEENADLWDNFASIHVDKFLTNKFPCELD